MPAREKVVDWLITGAGVAVAIWGAVLIAVVGALLTPFRVGVTLVPVSLIVVVVGMVAVVRFAFVATRRRWLALLPAAVWLVISMAAASRTAEGDLVLIQTNWVATTYLIAGSLAAGLAGYRLFLPARRGAETAAPAPTPPAPAPTPPAPAPTPPVGPPSA